MDETSRRITFERSFPYRINPRFSFFSSPSLFLCDNNRNLRSFDDVYRLRKAEIEVSSFSETRLRRKA